MLDERQPVSYPDVDVSDDGRIAVIYDFGRVGPADILASVFRSEELQPDQKLPVTLVSSLVEKE